MGCSQSNEGVKKSISKSPKSREDIMLNQDFLLESIYNTKVKPKTSSLITDRYKIGSSIGKGSYSTVQLASFHENDSQLVAVKSMHKTLNEQSMENCIIHEMHVLNQLDHPSVIKFYEAYESENTIDAVLEYSPGLTLDEVRSQMEPGYTFDKIAIIYLVAKGVAYLKSKNIVHRDLKPANIIVANNEELLLGYSIQLIDFGFAKDHDKDKAVCGSPKYMAPEALVKESSPASDVWSLGVILYNMISGSFPFTGDDASELFDSISLDYLAFSPAATWGDVPIEVVELIQRMLEKNPRKRISIEEVLAHKCFAPVQYITKSIDLTEAELDNIRTFSTLSKFAKKLISYSTRFIEPESVMTLKERFLIFDSQNLGYIPVITKLEKKYSISKHFPNRIRSYSDCNTVDTMPTISQKKIGSATTICCASYVAAMIAPQIFKDSLLSSLIFNNLKGDNSEEVIGIDQLEDSTFFKDGEDDVIEELTLMTSRKGGITKQWLADYLTTISNKLAASS